MQTKPLIDWCTVRIAGEHTANDLIVDVLGMDYALFEVREFSPVPGYRRSKFFGNIAVCYDALPSFGEDADKHRSSDQMGVCISMPGSGCRTYENMSAWRKKPGGAFTYLFEQLHANPEASFTRIDLAMDERNDLLDMNQISEYAMGEGLNARIDKVRDVHERDGGHTIYLGAPSSMFRVRIYDKAKEQYTPKQVEYNQPWIRLEIVMRGKMANGFVAAFCNTDDLGALASGILNDHLRFIERDDVNITRCSTAQWWLDFIESVEAVKLLLPEPIQHTMDRLGQWLTYQISPSLSTFYKAYGMVGLRKMLEFGDGRMSAKHNAILKDFKERKVSG